MRSAPAAKACNAICGERAAVTITTRVVGETRRTLRVASMPSMLGMCTSIRTTSGRNASASETPSTPLDAEPTTSMRWSIPSVSINASANNA